MSIDGVLNVNKPAGLTSHDVVARVRRVLSTKRVGHAGTLDPDATGVLVVAVGQATRLLPFLPLEPKIYVARAVFGVTTTTEDASGTVLEECDAGRITETGLLAVLPRFTGVISQIPPMVSAVHHEGRRLYELAREGKTVERAARKVTIQALAASDFVAGQQAEATLHVTCGGGTYIRTLCADIGTTLGVGGHMKSLVREAVGNFRLADALPLADLTSETARARLLPLESVLNLPTVAVDDAANERLGRGQSVAAPDALTADAETVALLHQGRLRALARPDESAGTLLPFKVFAISDDADDEHPAPHP